MIKNKLIVINDCLLENFSPELVIFIFKILLKNENYATY